MFLDVLVQTPYIPYHIAKSYSRSSSAFTKQSAHANRRLKIKGRVELQLDFGLKFDKI